MCDLANYILKMVLHITSWNFVFSSETSCKNKSFHEGTRRIRKEKHEANLNIHILQQNLYAKVIFLLVLAWISCNLY